MAASAAIVDDGTAYDDGDTERKVAPQYVRPAPDDDDDEEDEEEEEEEEEMDLSPGNETGAPGLAAARASRVNGTGFEGIASDGAGETGPARFSYNCSSVAALSKQQAAAAAQRQPRAAARSMVITAHTNFSK